MKVSDVADRLLYGFGRMEAWGGKPVESVHIAGHALKIRQSVQRRGKRFNYRLGPYAVAKWWVSKCGPILTLKVEG